MAVPKISVVIPTLNRADVLAQTIERIESQTIPSDSYEVIVVDNASTDATRNVLEAKRQKHPNLNFIFQSKPGVAGARNAGVRKASGEIVLFIDDDIFAETDLVERHVEIHSQCRNSSAIGTVLTPWDDCVDPFLRYLQHKRIYNPYGVGSGPIDFSHYHTGNVSTPRSMLVEAGGFNEEFYVYGMEDIELGYRLEKRGCRMINGKQARAVHYYFPTYDEFVLRCKQAGYSLGKLIELHPELERRFVENGKWTKFLKPFHQLYSVSSYGIESASRWLAKREAQQGTGPISRSLELHYYWSIRYHFFLGYKRYRSSLGDGTNLRDEIWSPGRRVPDLSRF